MASSRQRSSPDSSPRSDDESGLRTFNNPDGSVKEQDRFLPIANVSRIMKKTLPANAKISKDAKETVQECVSEFISFITGEASDKCQREKRKTINGDDLLWAMGTLGFENYVEPLKLYLQNYRELEGEKTSMARQGGGGEQSPPAAKEQPSGGGAAGNGGSNVHGANPVASKFPGAATATAFYPQQQVYGSLHMYGAAAGQQQQVQQQMLGEHHVKSGKAASGQHQHGRGGQW